MRKIIIFPALAIALSLAGCAHQPEIQQGNVITEEQLQKVKIGMEPRQVVFLLGSPLLRDPFHEGRWDYYYRLEQNGDEQLRYRVTLRFENERLADVEKFGPIPDDERAALNLLRDGRAAPIRQPSPPR